MRTYEVGYFVGSLSSTSINRVLSRALIRLAPDDLAFTELPIGNLSLYSPDYDTEYPPEAIQLKDAIRRSDAVLFVTPEYNRSIPGALKNAIDWASRPWGRERLRPHPGRRDRRVDRVDRDGSGPAEPARRLEFLQRPTDDGPGGLHPVLTGGLRGRRRGEGRSNDGVSRRFHERVPRPRRSGPHRASARLSSLTR
jgi:hypothetical protein